MVSCTGLNSKPGNPTHGGWESRSSPQPPTSNLVGVGEGPTPPTFWIRSTTPTTAFPDQPWACILADVFRVNAPDHPFTAEQLRSIFDAWLRQFALLADPKQAGRLQVMYLLERTASVKSFIVLPRGRPIRSPLKFSLSVFFYIQKLPNFVGCIVLAPNLLLVSNTDQPLPLIGRPPHVEDHPGHSFCRKLEVGRPPPPDR